MSDYISRQKAIEAIMDLPNCPNGYSDTYDKECIIGMIEEVPTADVRENVHAHWKDEWHIVFHVNLPKCSSCGGYSPLRHKFCPNCGAQMDERREEHDNQNAD